MLSRLLFVRLKSAENALRDGRLDEAYRLATAPDIREHRRGAAVLAKLTDLFLDRARTHFRADRFTEAMMDLDRAETGGVRKEDIAELREHVKTVSAEAQRRDAARRNQLDDARKHIEGGSLVAGRKILEQASEGNHAAESLRRRAEQRGVESAEIVQQVERLIVAGQTAAAVSRLRRAKRINAHDAGIARVETQLCNHALENARAALTEGRMGRASDELACLGDLGGKLPAKREMADMLAIARECMGHVQANRFADAKRQAMALARLLPDAPWVAEVADQLRQMDEIRTAVVAGPLGDRIDANAARPAPAIPASLDDTVALPAITGDNANGLPQRLLLLVDGGGSYLILRNPRVSVGRVASDNPADIAIVGDVAERHANLQRVDDDFFLFTDKHVEVGGRRTKHQLLRDGDRIVLGRRAKMTFRLPSRKSPSAILDLSDTTKMPNDVRRVVLFHRHASVGSGASAHIRCAHAGPALVLFERDGSLWLRQKNDGHVGGDVVQLVLGQPVEIAGASLALQPWEPRAPGTSVV